MSTKEGSYQWVIDGSLFNKIVNAENGKEFVSDVFTIGELNWKIEIYPNGQDDEDLGAFKVFVELLSLPTSWKSVIIRMTTQCEQTKLSYTTPCTYKSGDSFGWQSNILRLEEIKSLNSNNLIFVIKIRILRIILKNRNKIMYNYKFNNIKTQQFTWNLNKETLIISKNAYNGKLFESNIFNNMWSIGLYPNGYETEDNGKCWISLTLCAFESSVYFLDIQWKVSIKQLNFKKTKTLVNYEVTKFSWMIVGSFSDFKKCSELSIEIEVIILKQYDINKKEIAVKSIKKWENYDDDNKMDNKKRGLNDANINTNPPKKKRKYNNNNNNSDNNIDTLINKKIEELNELQKQKQTQNQHFKNMYENETKKF